MLDRLRDIHINPKDMAIKAFKVGIAVNLGFGIGYVLDRLAIHPPKIPTLTPPASFNPVDLINSTFGPSQIIDNFNVLPNSLPRETKAPYPEIVSQPLLIVNNEHKTLIYGPKNLEAEKIAGAYIVGTKRIDPDIPVVETIKFNLVKMSNDQYRIDLGDQILRKFSISTALDPKNNKVNLGIQYEIPDSKNSPTIDLKSLIAIELNQVLSPDPLLSAEILENPLKKIEVSLEKIEKITLYGPNQVTIVLDRKFIEQYPSESKKLLDLFLTMAKNFPAA